MTLGYSTHALAWSVAGDGRADGGGGALGRTDAGRPTAAGALLDWLAHIRTRGHPCHV